MDENRICVYWNCSSIAQICCNACEEAWYCNKQHQRLDWQQHYLDCRSYKVKQTEFAGKCLVASRKIKAGAKIMSDEPLAVGPLMSSDLICLTCFSMIYEENLVKCPDCHWPMCSTECYLSKKHDKECDVLAQDKNHWAVPSSFEKTPRYDLILIIRCLMLKQESKDKFDIILMMASHHEEMTKKEDPFHITAVRMLTEVWKFSKEEVDQVRGAIVGNAFEIRTSQGNTVRAVYPTLRLFNHSCLPNVQLSSRSDGKMEVKAAVDIEKNSELVITYTGTDQTLWDRQTCLNNIHFFKCGCVRCSDRTELGTHFSAPKCPKCRGGEFMESCQETLQWKCPKCQTCCDASELQREVDDWLFRLEMNELFGTGAVNKISNGMFQIEKEFHNQHYMYMKAAQLGLQKLKQNNSLAALRLKRDLWQNILNIFDVLEPGLTRHRGMILFELGNVFFKMAEIGEQDSEFSKAQLENYSREARMFYLQSHKIFALEPQFTIEHDLSLLIQRNIKYIQEHL